MSHRFICLVVLLILGVAIQFSNCKSTVNCDERSEIASDKTRLSPLEKMLKTLKIPLDVTNDAVDSLKGVLNGILGKKNSTSNSSKSSFGSVLNRFASHIHAIFPGTLWCGDGNITKKEEDLGLFKKTDACCKEHDFCKHNIASHDTKDNLNNNGIFTRSACYCDAKFYSCLKDVSSIVSFKVGTMYFNILGPQCYECACPDNSCSDDNSVECIDQCSKYEWKNNPKY